MSPRSRRLVRVALVVAACAAGAFAALGCALALHFELSGFGRSRDSGVRPLYTAALLAGIVASFAVPALVWRALAPRSAPSVAVVALLALVLAVTVFGVDGGR